jgi:septum formation protein
MNKDILYLGSQSESRRKLLDVAGISYKMLTHASKECVAVPTDNFDDYVLSIACDKMQHLQLPDLGTVEKNYIFVLTADTLVKATQSNQIIGKPNDLEHAKSIVRLIRTQPLQILTGCCLKRFEKSEKAWIQKNSKTWVTGALVEFCVPEEDINLYFERLPGVVHASGASIIDDFGQCFLKSINGSHSAVIGLPLFELRQNLKDLGFVL